MSCYRNSYGSKIILVIIVFAVIILSACNKNTDINTSNDKGGEIVLSSELRSYFSIVNILSEYSSIETSSSITSMSIYSENTSNISPDISYPDIDVSIKPPLPMKELQSVISIIPDVTYVPQYDYNENVKAIFYTGMDYKGNKTRIFAYIGIPASASITNKVPGTVCIHGGGGVAYGQWVQLWNDKGYAAIAMSHFGEIPSVEDQYGYHPFILDSQGASPFTPSIPSIGPFDTIEEPINQQWAYYAISSTILANSILRLDERVSKEKIGLTGISWGGIFAGIAAGIDNRFAFAIPVYGCGYLEESNTYFKYFYQIPKVKEYWDVSGYLPYIKMPVLWLNSDNDDAFSINSFSKTATNTFGSAIVIKHLLPHGYFEGWGQDEIYLFADWICKSGNSFARINSQPKEAMGKNVFVDVTIPSGSKVQRVIAYYTNEPLKHENEWFTMIGKYSEGIANVILPDGVDSYYINIEIDNELSTYTISTQLISFIQ